MSVAHYPQPPAACLEQQQREAAASQRSWQGERAVGETVGERKEGGEDENGIFPATQFDLGLQKNLPWHCVFICFFLFCFLCVFGSMYFIK